MKSLLLASALILSFTATAFAESTSTVSDREKNLFQCHFKAAVVLQTVARSLGQSGQNVEMSGSSEGPVYTVLVDGLTYKATVQDPAGTCRLLQIDLPAPSLTATQQILTP
jgi:hypothetical protein